MNEVLALFFPSLCNFPNFIIIFSHFYNNLMKVGYIGYVLLFFTHLWDLINN